MKKKYLFALAFVATFLSISAPNAAHAQDAGIENSFFLGKDDAEKILKEYIAPAPKLIGLVMADGWYFTAQPLKRGAWNIQLNTSTVIGDVKDASYDLSKLNLQNTATPNGVITPTLFGGPGIIVENNKNGKKLTLGDGFNEITPIDQTVLSLPNFQLNIGLRKNTEISLRGLPPINFAGVSVKTFGFGIKHDIKQWFPSISLSSFSLAVVANFNYFSFEKQLTPTSNSGFLVKPTDRIYGVTSLQYGGGIVFSKRIKLLTLMTGLRFDIVKGTGELKGTYNVYTPSSGGAGTDNPTNIGVLTLENSITRVGLNLGAKIKLGKFGVFLQAIVSNYSSVNFGFVFGKNE